MSAPQLSAMTALAGLDIFGEADDLRGGCGWDIAADESLRGLDGRGNGSFAAHIPEIGVYFHGGLCGAGESYSRRVWAKLDRIA